MTVEELAARFPEIPADLHGEPVLARFAETFGEQLRTAHKPSNCSVEYDAGNHYYMKLVNPIGIYRLGLAKRERLLQQLEDLIEKHGADPASLAPEGTAASEVRGPGCA